MLTFVAVLSLYVHGLDGDPVDTWTNKKTGAYWLRDYLPADIEGARVMTYSYNSDVAFGNTVADIEDFAKDLLNSLIDKREQDEVSRNIQYPRPLTDANGQFIAVSQTHYIHRPFTRWCRRKTGRSEGAVIQQKRLIRVELQAFTAAHVNPRFQNVKERTISIAFFGTPHRGSEKASYGRFLLRRLRLLCTDQVQKSVAHWNQIVLY